jgi:outer membrane lipoprotein-sorting protein
MKSSHLLPKCIPVLVLSLAAWAQPPAPAGSSAELERVLNRMDETAASFRSTQANFIWDQYQAVVEAKDTQEGRVFFRRAANQIEMAAEIAKVDGKPQPKYVIFSDNKVQMYQPGNGDVVDVYDTGKNKETFESLLVLGFGGSGHGMLKSFEVTYAGQETLIGVSTDKLDLVPKSEKARNIFSHIVLWIDPRGFSVQQQLFNGEGDYRLAKYFDIQPNQKISDSVFRLKTTGKTKIVSH